MVSATSPRRPRRTDGAGGSNVAASSSAPVAESATAATGRQPGCSQSIATPTDSRPSTPDDEADQDLGPGAVLAGAQHDHQAGHHREQRARDTERDRERGHQHEQEADGRGDADRISWAVRASAPTRSGSMSSGSAVMSATV